MFFAVWLYIERLIGRTGKHGGLVMRRNIILLRIISGVRWFLLVMPVLILFYESNDLTLFQAITIQAFFSLCVLIMEVPTGYLGDRFGWRCSLILGSIMASVGMLLLSMSSSYGLFAISEFCMAMAYCLFSGSDSALLYESLVDMKKEHEYLGEEGVLLAVGYIGEGVAAILGGFLAYASLRLPVIINFFVFLSLIPLSVLLCKPKSNKNKSLDDVDLQGGRYLRKDAYAIIQFIADDPLLRWVALYSGFTGFLALMSAWLMQSYFKLTGYEIYYIGILWAMLNFAKSLAAGFVNKINHFLGTRQLFFIAPMVMACCALCMGVHVSLFTMLLGLIIQSMRGVQLPLVFMIINNRCRSDIRAAILSVEGMVMRIFFVLLGPLIGLLINFESINVAFYAISILSAVGGLFVYYKFQYYFKATELGAGV